MLYLLGCIIFGAGGIIMLSASAVVPLPMKLITVPLACLAFYYCGKYAKKVYKEVNSNGES